MHNIQQNLVEEFISSTKINIVIFYRFGIGADDLEHNVPYTHYY